MIKLFRSACVVSILHFFSRFLIISSFLTTGKTYSCDHNTILDRTTQENGYFVFKFKILYKKINNAKNITYFSPILLKKTIDHTTFTHRSPIQLKIHGLDLGVDPVREPCQ